MSLPIDIMEMINRITDAVDIGDIEINEWESKFIEDMNERNHISDKQIAVLVKIHNRIKA